MALRAWLRGISGLVAMGAAVACSGGASPSGPSSAQQGDTSQHEDVPAHCGGNVQNPATCPDGYECVVTAPDVGGTCAKIEGSACGGNVKDPKTCPSGYVCVVPDDVADVGGTCHAAQPCGGNAQNAPTCPAGSTCTPYPGSKLPFGDVGGYCRPNT